MQGHGNSIITLTSNTLCPEKKSLRYFRHIFDKLKPIFIIFGMHRPEYSLY